MKEKLEQIRLAAQELLDKATEPAAIEELRVKFLGKKGELTAILKQMGQLAADERPAMGQLANTVREAIESSIEKRRKELTDAALNKRLESERLDVTLPGEPTVRGELHPLDKALEQVKQIFLGMGFDVVDGPEVEFDHYCFEMLCMPKGHPARDTQDTFYIDDNILLRTQTSSVQVRTMLSRKPPIRIISPGRVYRVDPVDATHSPVFHQVEGLVVDKGIRMSDLKGTLEQLTKKLYGEDMKVRFRPHHFPYTEPSAEMDVTCFRCHGKGCRLCKGEGYIELLGCGMVHPQVLENCGIDSTVYSGFAFGVGLERLTMPRYDIDDLRLFFENDVRFLKQF